MISCIFLYSDLGIASEVLLLITLDINIIIALVTNGLRHKDLIVYYFVLS